MFARETEQVHYIRDNQVLIVKDPEHVDRRTRDVLCITSITMITQRNEDTITLFYPSTSRAKSRA